MRYKTNNRYVPQSHADRSGQTALSGGSHDCEVDFGLVCRRTARRRNVLAWAGSRLGQPMHGRAGGAVCPVAASPRQCSRQPVPAAAAGTVGPAAPHGPGPDPANRRRRSRPRRSRERAVEDDECCGLLRHARLQPAGRVLAAGRLLDVVDQRHAAAAAGDHQPAGHPRGQAGVLGLPATTILFGDRTVGNDRRRASARRWACGSTAATFGTWSSTTSRSASGRTASTSSPPAIRSSPGPSSTSKPMPGKRIGGLSRTWSRGRSRSTPETTSSRPAYR